MLESYDGLGLSAHTKGVQVAFGLVARRVMHNDPLHITDEKSQVPAHVLLLLGFGCISRIQQALEYFGIHRMSCQPGQPGRLRLV